MRQADFIRLDDGRIEAAAGFAPVLRQNQLDHFAQIMALQSGIVIRAVPGRSTVRIHLPLLTGDLLIGYLKRYELDYLSTWKRLLRGIRWPGTDDEAVREWRKIWLLRQHGFLTAEPIALGQQRCCGVVIASFLLQREISGGAPADEYLQRLGAERRRPLLMQLGALARRLHDAGFIHKDLYLKHIFVVERGKDWDLYLIDLQRLLGPRRHRERWYFKDAAALGYSARAHARCSATDLLRLYLGYARGAIDKQRMRKIWTRVQRLQQRTPKYRRIWNAPRT